MANTTASAAAVVEDNNSSFGGVSGTTFDLLTLTIVGADGFICVSGLIGNALVIYVVSRSSFKSKSVTTKTFILNLSNSTEPLGARRLLNLSVTDTLFLLGLPMIVTTALARRWVFGAVLCRVYFALTCVNMFTGTFTVMLMSVDRFVAVWWPVVCNRSASRPPSPLIHPISFHSHITVCSEELR